MNELLDKLILRIFFTLFICFIIFVYKYFYTFVYPSSKNQLFRQFTPSKNPADTLVLFSRLIGMGIIFSELKFHMQREIIVVLLNFFTLASVSCMLYLLSIYVIDGIVLYNFEYLDEIVKRKNLPYALISFSHSISMAFLLKIILSISEESIIIILLLWLFSMIIVGFCTKTFSILSQLPFNRLLVQKNIAIAPSYMGFIFGWTIVISNIFNHRMEDIQWYGIQVLLKLILTLIIIPFFQKGITFLFKVKEENVQDDLLSQKNKKNKSDDSLDGLVGHGFFEGSLFFTACFLTTVIIENIDFGTFYPA